MNSVMALHEILHETKRNKEVGVVLKLDFEKAYDKVNWNFLFDCLHLWGFCDTWINWIKTVVTGGIVCVKLNNIEGPYLSVTKGLVRETLFHQSYSILWLTVWQEWLKWHNIMDCFVV